MRMNNNTSWLTTVPANDQNFKDHLKVATDEEIRKSILVVGMNTGVKTKIAALERELRKRGSKHGT